MMTGVTAICGRCGDRLDLHGDGTRLDEFLILRRRVEWEAQHRDCTPTDEGRRLQAAMRGLDQLQRLAHRYAHRLSARLGLRQALHRNRVKQRRAAGRPPPVRADLPWADLLTRQAEAAREVEFAAHRAMGRLMDGGGR